MAVEVTMPRLSDSMEEGTILRWLKSVGDEVKRGDELVEIETDKANMTYEASDEGMLVEIVAGEGDTLHRRGDRPHRRSERENGGQQRRPRRPRRREPAAGRAAAAEPRGAAAPPRSLPRPPAGRSAGDASRPERTDGSRRRRWRGGWRESWASSCGRSQGCGPGGRIVKADVEAAAGGAPDDRAPGQAATRRRAPAGPRRRGARDGQGRGAGDRAQPPPAHGGAEHGGVEGDGAPLLPPDGDRHDGGGRECARS